MPGVVLITLILVIGLAAYNTGNNILFITLALLLSSLVLSGVLSWMNLAGTEWRLRPVPPFRAGQDASVWVELRNRKRLLPSYALWLDMVARPSGVEGRLVLPGRLDVGGELGRLEWRFRPARRGLETVTLDAVGSLFPFGFMRKSASTGLSTQVIVWPERVACHFIGAAAARFRRESQEVARPGTGSDLLNLRPYRAGDPLRHIHWKASARLRQLFVRQHATEGAATFGVLMETSASVWTRPEQFELLCSFAGSLAEELFRLGRLESLAIDGEAPLPVLRVRDLETWLDRLALLEPSAPVRRRVAAGARGALITFEPDGERGVRAKLGNDIAARI
jgi:uncharacterized protein (DUF58 family)